MGGSAQYPGASTTSGYGATSYLGSQGAPQQQFSSYGNQNRDVCHATQLATAPPDTSPHPQQVYQQMHQPATQQQRYQQQSAYPVQQRTPVASGMSGGYGQQYGSNAQYSRESGSSLSGGASYMGGGSRQTDFSQFNLPSTGGR